MKVIFKSRARSFGVGKFSFKSEAVWILIFSLFPLMTGALMALVLWLAP